MKLFTLLLFLTSLAYAQTDADRVRHYNIKKQIGLEGYDPISYFDSKPIEGKSDFKYTYRGITYLFANAQNLNRFKENPEKYEPAYGGWCAYAMGDSGEKVKIDPETYKIINGKLYLFYNFWGNNTLTTWNKSEAPLKSKADLNWKKFIP